MTAHAPQRLPFLFFAKHRLDIVQVLAICRFSPFNGRVAPSLLRANAFRSDFDLDPHFGLRATVAPARLMSNERPTSCSTTSLYAVVVIVSLSWM
jgi:hypothetical protein